jgi:CRISPR-associated protein Cmr6
MKGKDVNSVLNAVAKLKLDESTNLWSYMTLRGAKILLESLGSSDVLGELKRELLEQISSINLSERLKEAERVIDCWAEALSANGYLVKVVVMEAESRVVVGTSSGLGRIPFEVGLSFDPVTNLPYIPGSTIKGAIRSAFREILSSSTLVREGKCNQESIDKTMDQVFGSSSYERTSIGLVGFTDAYPVSPGNGNRVLEPDVITPHHTCTSDEGCTEFDLTPIPIQFLTIASGTRFKFLMFFNNQLRSKKLDTVSSTELGKADKVDCNKLSYMVYYDHKELGEALARTSSHDRSNLIPWLDRAVLYAVAKGLGAKTSVGYSRFRIVSYTTFRGGSSASKC